LGITLAARARKCTFCLLDRKIYSPSNKKQWNI